MVIAFCDRFLRLRTLPLCDHDHHRGNYGEHLLLCTLSEYTCDEHSSDQKTALRYCVRPDALVCLLEADFHPLKYHDIRYLLPHICLYLAPQQDDGVRYRFDTSLSHVEIGMFYMLACTAPDDFCCLHGQRSYSTHRASDLGLTQEPCSLGMLRILALPRRCRVCTTMVLSL